MRWHSPADGTAQAGETLAPIAAAQAGNVMLLAVYLGQTRLIDNLRLPAVSGRLLSERGNSINNAKGGAL